MGHATPIFVQIPKEEEGGGGWEVHQTTSVISLSGNISIHTTRLGTMVTMLIHQTGSILGHATPISVRIPKEEDGEMAMVSTPDHLSNVT